MLMADGCGQGKWARFRCWAHLVRRAAPHPGWLGAPRSGAAQRRAAPPEAGASSRVLQEPLLSLSFWRYLHFPVQKCVRPTAVARRHKQPAYVVPTATARCDAAAPLTKYAPVRCDVASQSALCTILSSIFSKVRCARDCDLYPKKRTVCGDCELNFSKVRCVRSCLVALNS